MCPLLPFSKTSPKLYCPVTDRGVRVTVNLRVAPGLRVIAGGLVSIAISGAILAVITYVSSSATFFTERDIVRVPTRCEIVIEGMLRFDGLPRV